MHMHAEQLRSGRMRKKGRRGERERGEGTE